MSFASNLLTFTSESAPTSPAQEASQSEESSPFSLSQHRPEEISKQKRYEEELQADRLSIQLKQRMAFKGASDTTDEFELLMSKGGAIQLQIKEMIKTTKQNINDKLKCLIEEEEESSEPTNAFGNKNPNFRRGQTIAFKSSNPLFVQKNDIIAEANEDDDSLKTDMDEDSNKDED